MNRLILGCGYLGKRVAVIWKNRGDDVYVLTRSSRRAAEFAELGMIPIEGDITQPDTLRLPQLPPIETVLFAVGMDRQKYATVREVYVDGLTNTLEALSGVPCGHFIYISSTGVYGDAQGAWLDEASETNPMREGGKACVAAEQLLLHDDHVTRKTILRFAGIYGPDRVPTRDTIKERKWNRLTANGHLNLIQVDDGASIVEVVADSERDSDEIYCVSDGAPPIRREYYEFIAQQLGIDGIPWSETNTDPTKSRSGSNKRISNKKLMSSFEFEFKFPDYRSGVVHAISN